MFPAVATLRNIYKLPFTLRPDQNRFDAAVHNMWGLGHRNVVGVAPTGFGKTVSASALVREKNDLGWLTLIVAHRKELIEQWGLALAQFGIPHTFIAPPATRKQASDRQHEELGRSMYDANARAIIASVDTLKNKDVGMLASSLDLWICDEAHHCLTSNKWGKSVGQFSHALGLGLTATPERADGKGIGRQAHGIFDAIVTGPTLRELIDAGNLSDYEILVPPNDLDRGAIPVGKVTGDYTDKGLTLALDKSHVYGDMVGHYKEHAYGKLSLVFCVDVNACNRLAAEYRQNGIPALSLSAKNTSAERADALRKLRTREIWAIVNCDLFGEGFDCPAVEVVQDGQPTKSYPKFAQKFGRSLRKMPGNPGKIALYIDHVGNVIPPDGHGLPDHRSSWSLADRPKNTRATPCEQESPIKVCGDCRKVFEAELRSCPFCGWVPGAMPAAALEQIEGSLVRLSGAQLTQLREQVARADRSPEEVRDAMLFGGYSDKISYGRAAAHRRMQDAQTDLRHTTALWAGLMRGQGLRELEQELFTQRFGVNILAAQAYNRADAEKLTEAVRADMAIYLQ